MLFQIKVHGNIAEAESTKEKGYTECLKIVKIYFCNAVDFTVMNY